MPRGAGVPKGCNEISHAVSVPVICQLISTEVSIMFCVRTFATGGHEGISSTITLSINRNWPLYAHGFGGKNGT